MKVEKVGLTMKLNANINTHFIVNNRNAAMDQLRTSVQRLSSGKEINQASDNVSNFNKSTELDMRIRMLNKTTQNLQDELNYAKFKESALDQINQSVQRMRELKVQSENETLTTNDLRAIEHEFTELQNAIGNTYNNTEYNNKNVFNNHNDGLNQNFKNSVSHMTDNTTSVIDYSLDDIDAFHELVLSELGKQGAKSQGIEANIRLNNAEVINLSNEMSAITDADIAKEAMIFTKAKLLNKVSINVLVHAKHSQENILSLLKT
jgi:flagellin